MILSASRRTDIPAFYSEWFFSRLKEGYFMVRNPMNFNQVSKVIINPSVIDCIVFWTKNPKPMLSRIDELDKYNYYFQFTLNSYDTTLEANVPQKKYLIETFEELSKKLGKERVIWRYDPIILSDKFTKEYHYKWFDFLAKRLHKYTNRCVISFLDLYTKTQRNLSSINLLPINKSDMEEIASNLSNIAIKYGLIIESCSEEINLSKYNINHGKCIDDRVISQIIGRKIQVDKDPNQREVCGCVKSIDIGAYNTCKHGCAYCYANFSNTTVEKNVLMHDIKSPLIAGSLTGNEKITERVVESFLKSQVSFLDDI